LGSFAVTTQTPAHDRLYSGHPHTPEMHSSFEPAGQLVADVHALPLPPPRLGPPELELPPLVPEEPEEPLLPEEPEEPLLPEEPDEPLLPSGPGNAPLDPSSPASAVPPAATGFPSLPHATTMAPTPSVEKTRM
jgi:hypothetical protein